jgi:hypothetical protein
MIVTDIPGIADAAVVELRQYTLEPGAADTLVDLFEAKFVESQEALGMRLGGLFRDRDDDDRFVWMRGFASMAERRRGLAAFYGGPVWRTHGAAANATMVDSDDVLLLRPTEPAHPPQAPRPRPPVGARVEEDPWVLVTCWLHEPGLGTCSWLASDVQPELAAALGTSVATWRTEPAENTFPALPVRDDHAFVWTATFADRASYDVALDRLEADPAWRTVAARLDGLGVVTQTLRLRPTARSEHPPPG